MAKKPKQTKLYGKSIKNWPEDERPREKLLKFGEHTLTNAELLAILLRSGVKGNSAVDLGRKLITKFSTFRNMGHTDISQWREVKGLGEAKICQIKAALEKVKNRLDSNLKKQSKLTDAYLENLLSEELYKQKNKGLRQEEEEVKKLIALQEVREIERERSRDYLDRVEEFISGYDPNKKEIDSLTKKLMLNLLFKNIEIAHKKIFSFEFFDHFNFLFFEKDQKSKCQTNQRLMKNLPPKSLSGLSVAR